ncbi:hypothetical protein H0H92_014126, partial [Tricholoma furcatifolium]
MFARLSAAVLLALPIFAAAQGCSTGTQQCCNSLEDASSANVANLLFNVLGAAAQGVTGQVGGTSTSRNSHLLFQPIDLVVPQSPAPPSPPSASLATPATSRPCAARTTTS